MTRETAAKLSVSLSKGTDRRLYARSRAATWDLSPASFSLRLRTSVAACFRGASVATREADACAESLHVEDLALACACAAGHEGAWEHFVLELRPVLYAAARHIAPAAGEELADSLFAELFGLDVRDGRRRSLLDYYHGRARLSTWLRTVLAQRYIDVLRKGARTVSLDEESGEAVPAPVIHPLVETRRTEYVAMTQRALDAAVVALEPRARLCLRLYYGERLRLAKIGLLTGEHEATISRRLDRARRDIRRHVEELLRTEYGLTPDAVVECLELAAGGPELDVARILGGDERA